MCLLSIISADWVVVIPQFSSFNAIFSISSSLSTSSRSSEWKDNQTEEVYHLFHHLSLSYRIVSFTFIILLPQLSRSSFLKQQNGIRISN